MKIKHLIFNAALIWLCALRVMAQEATVPKYLQIARDFVANTKQENNVYSIKGGYTKTPDEMFSGGKYVVNTDCSGFVGNMLRRGETGVVEGMATKRYATRDSLQDYYKAIVDGTTFKRLLNVTDVQPGDVAVWLYVAGEHSLPGHTLFFDSVPVSVAPGKQTPVGMVKYEVYVIDVSQEAKSKDDTRYVADEELRDQNEARGRQRGSIASKNYKGVGRGKIYLYADASGALKGASFGFANAKFHENKVDWDIVLGKPVLKQR